MCFECGREDCVVVLVFCKHCGAEHEVHTVPHGIQTIVFCLACKEFQE